MRHYFCLLFLLFYTGNPLFTQITEYPELEGWKIIKKENYNPKTLFDHINGAADSYLKYEFQELTLIEYTKGDDYIISESYYHKNPSFAWGIYRSERPEEASFIKAGVEGYKEERSINFTAGSYYIKIYSNSEDNNIQNDMIQLADNMSETINYKPTMPDIFSLLPDNQRIKQSEHFIAKSFLGFDVLNHVYTAEYETSNIHFKAFIIQLDEPAEAINIIKTYKKKAPLNILMEKENIFIAMDKYNGLITISWDNDHFFGIIGTDNEVIQREYLDLFKY